ncbi:MAG: RIP metalloprotease RseP [Candidatus Magasanikbacteria bacterium]|uniref:Zinc metalloprotease n=1 Tax=Candidatus Magasanikbacteria bacterium CG10_big_fil_rev_8_21_14_0_10_38_6 TaxID=1974647 RepID=A0A2M6P0Z3_9BACT|nr:RIP metalloprotease RseP [Candidatus Magasanikbacteria bacterium]NCS71825.1 RIP metalloprotease RseP [Candidatus Magasanikbacteria bacterium]PIR77374.1 MAG: RIP metalloprotease RseP [Candidatus Magasanikbacteria bacterium CG10_big_fil_rev_8_21_14_0_10_38_6]
MFTLILFILILSFLVFVHEFGHYITAKKSGMKVYEFAIGFPPRALGAYKDPKTGKWVWVVGKGKSNLKETIVGEEQEDEFPTTLYSINWLPLGGFVRIKGENGEKSKDKNSFGHQKAWKKVIVLSAGVIMNYLTAAILLGAGFMVGLPADISVSEDPHAIMVGESSVIIQQVQPNTPAKEAGLTLGDTIQAINGQEMNNVGQVIETIQNNGTEELSLTILRGEKEEVFHITPAIQKDGEPARIGALLADAGVVRYPWYLAMYKGFVAATLGVINIAASFFFLIKGLIMGQGLAFDVAGPVGIASIIGQSARLGFSHLINVTAMISLSLAVINILPIPALDGGRILFILIEKITKKKVPLKYEQLAHTIGFGLLMLLIIVVTVRDVFGLF